MKHLYFIVKGGIYVWKDQAIENTHQNALRKVTEECDLKPGYMIYLGISSQKNPSYGGSNNWILIKYSYTKQKLSSFTKEK